ncbi:MAG: hypothetical protein Alpg2KO_00120 [Alphaproteobacteria bacterium]
MNAHSPIKQAARMVTGTVSKIPTRWRWRLKIILAPVPCFAFWSFASLLHDVVPNIAWCIATCGVAASVLMVFEAISDLVRQGD